MGGRPRGDPPRIVPYQHDTGAEFIEDAYRFKVIYDDGTAADMSHEDLKALEERWGTKFADDAVMRAKRAHDILSSDVDDGGPQRAKDLPTRLLELALQDDTVLFTDPRGDAYAQVKCGGHLEILPIDRGFEQWLSNAFYARHGSVPGSEALRSATNALRGKARFDGERHELHIRVAKKDGYYWYYLGDERRRAVRVGREGWAIADEAPILFKHLAHMRPQDEPVRGRPGAGLCGGEMRGCGQAGGRGVSTDDHGKSPLFALSIGQQSAVDLVMVGPPDRRVADLIGVSREAETRWRNYHPAFQAELNRRRKKLWASGLERMRLLFPEAVDALRNVISDPANPNRLRAAVEVLMLAGLPGGFIDRNGPNIPEAIVQGEVERRKARQMFSALNEAPDKRETDEFLRELERNIGDGSD